MMCKALLDLLPGNHVGLLLFVAYMWDALHLHSFISRYAAVQVRTFHQGLLVKVMFRMALDNRKCFLKTKNDFALLYYARVHGWRLIGCIPTEIQMLESS